MKANRDERAYEMLVAPIENKMIRIIGRIVATPDAADDVLQDVLATIWRKLSRIERHPNPHAYVLRICLSCSLDHLREQKRRKETVLASEPEYSGMGPSDVLIAQEATETVLEAIRHLPPKQAQAVLLRALQDCSYSEIGEVLGCSHDTARSHFCKGIARVRYEIFSRKAVMSDPKETSYER